MKKVKCKQCDCDIFHEYDAIECLNTKKGKEKYLSELEQVQTETCYTSIYLTCGNGHFDKYFSKIETRD
jgi:hypothetical protein